MSSSNNNLSITAVIKKLAATESEAQQQLQAQYSSNSNGSSNDDAADFSDICWCGHHRLKHGPHCSRCACSSFLA